jgi:hypothetical protein
MALHVYIYVHCRQLLTQNFLDEKICLSMLTQKWFCTKRKNLDIFWDRSKDSCNWIPGWRSTLPYTQPRGSAMRGSKPVNNPAWPSFARVFPTVIDRS